MTHEDAVVHLTDFAAGRVDDAALRHAIAGHVVDCAECQGVVAIAEDVETLAASGFSLGRPARSIWPAALAACLLVAALGAWWWVRPSREGSEAVVVATVLPPDPGPLRGPGEAPPVDVWVSGQRPSATLVLGLAAAAPLREAHVEVAREDGTVVWRAEAGMLEPVNGTIWISMAVPSRLLAPGVHVVTAADGAAPAVVSRRFRVLRLP